MYIVRHGDKETGDFFNPRLGQDDQPLSAYGQSQAEALRRHFEDRAIERVYVSEYVRTHQTIGPFCELRGIEPIELGLLNEIDGGEYFRVGEAEQRRRYPRAWDRLRERRRDFRYPGGESGRDVLNRARRFFALAEREGVDSIAVSHEGWIKTALCFVLGLDPGRRFRFQVDTCGIAELEYFEAGRYWRVLRFNQALGSGPPVPPTSSLSSV